MSVYNLWDNHAKEPILKNSLSSEWNYKTPIATPRSASPTYIRYAPNSKVGEQIFDNYIDLIHSKSDISTNAKQTEQLDRPFDFFDDEEFAFGINLLNNNVACVGDNITKLIQMAQEPWPDNVKLYQPYEVEQILLPDNASCLAVQSFLKMCNLPFEVEMRWNAEFMSPSGRVPFIKCGAFVVSELEPIVQFAANKGVTLCTKLSTEEKAEMRAYMSLITNVLVNAELYVSWLDNDTFNTVTKVRNSSVYPWPLGWLQTRSKRNAVAKRLKALNWHDKTLEQVLSDVEQCCNSLSQRLGERDYFFGTPTPLDSLIHGHLRALLSASGPKAALMIKPITSALLRHTLRMSDLTQMKLTAQEEYLISQAFRLCTSRRFSPDRIVSDRSNRMMRSKLCIRKSSRDFLKKTCSNNDVFGFKPFASKKFIVMSSKDGEVTCGYEDAKIYNKETVNYIGEVIDDILDVVDEKAIDVYDEKPDFSEKNDFEIITVSNHYDSKCNSPGVNELKMIEENDVHNIASVDAGPDIIIISEDDLMDSDGLVNDKLLQVANSSSKSGIQKSESIEKDSSNLYTNPKDVSSTEIEDRSGWNSSNKSELTLTSASFKGSKSTLKMPSNEEISIESLLNYLREKNATKYHQIIEVVDVD